MVCGYLKSQTGILKVWKKLYYKLDEDILREYTEENGREISNFDLKNCQIQQNEGSKIQYSFSLKTDKKVVTFKADNEDSWKIWYNSIKKVIDGQLFQSKQKRKKVSLNDFTMIRVIGKGQYGKVTLVRYEENGQLYALKSMHKSKIAKDNYIQQIMSEREILLNNQHPFLVSAHFTFQTKTNVFIVLDYVPGGELLNRLRIEGRFSERRTQLYAAEILLGIEHLHNHGIIYRDLKPENILVDADGHLKITDFGFAKNIENDENNSTKTFCGTLGYLAPEVIRQKPYTKSVDWWAFGIILYEMLCGHSPFESCNQSELMNMILFSPIDFPSYLSSTSIDLIQKLLNRDNKKRIGSGPTDAEEIKQHPFFKGLNWENVLEKKTRPQWVPSIVDSFDTSNFDCKFTSECTGISADDTTSISPGAQESFLNFTYDEQDSSIIE
ncbi:AGC family protein kinase [Histomonas meleagridis]|uniref:AGC family protein kinase n=1 Tax=Histomonas meleagridis TaxID=135588 RepID=UPI003559CA83|nr:AGC family protein kinase [Histomonas meleagridis]KAH0803066.1 AGC family protein kinase [Histomonas meleagridis]